MAGVPIHGVRGASDLLTTDTPPLPRERLPRNYREAFKNTLAGTRNQATKNEGYR